MKLGKGVETPILIHFDTFLYVFNGEKPQQSTSPITHRNLKSIHIWRTFASFFVLQIERELKKNTCSYAKIQMAAASRNSKMDRGRCESKERPFRFIRPFVLYLTSSSTGRLEAHAGSEGICVSWATGYCMLTHLVQAVGCWGPGLDWGPPSLRPTFLGSKASRLQENGKRQIASKKWAPLLRSSKLHSVGSMFFSWKIHVDLFSPVWFLLFFCTYLLKSFETW